MAGIPLDFEPESLRSRIDEGEGRDLEFKRGLPRDEKIARTLAAFANTRGGLLLVGITDDRRAYGVARPSEVIDRLRRVAASCIDPPVSLELRSLPFEGKSIVACSVGRSPKRPHACRGATGDEEWVVRVGASNRAARGATLRALKTPPARNRSLDALEKTVLDWVRSEGKVHAPRDQVTVARFCKARNCGKQRAQRAFSRLEVDGFLVSHGAGVRRTYHVP